MKTIKMFGLLLMATLVFASCSKDDDDDAPSIAGTKWETAYYETNMTGTKVVYDSKEELDDKFLYDVYEFKADGTLLLNDQNYGTWKQSGSKVELIDAEDEDFSEEWVISDGFLVNDGSLMEFTYITKYSQMK
ncbi:MAG: hypothetical protein JXR39_09805 [Marinilabiliaceae bacterium]|nr:hypothetical protein [Marinilabiliaceae bacterium]